MGGGKSESAVAVAGAAVDDAVLLTGGVADGRVGLVAEGWLDAHGGLAGEVLRQVSTVVMMNGGMVESVHRCSGRAGPALSNRIG